MDAYNWVTYSAPCPACGQDTRQRARLHAAASPHGQGYGRFFDRPYQLGDPLLWFPPGHPDREAWRAGAEEVRPGVFAERCAAWCLECGEDLEATLELAALRVTRVAEVRRLE